MKAMMATTVVECNEGQADEGQLCHLTQQWGAGWKWGGAGRKTCYLNMPFCLGLVWLNRFYFSKSTHDSNKNMQLFL